MWKKFIVVLLSLVGTFSVVFAMNRDMKAEDTALLKVGDKFKFGFIKTWSGMPAYDESPVVWLVLDVKGNEALVLQDGQLSEKQNYVASPANSKWNMICYTKKTCLTNGYPQKEGELYNFVFGTGSPSYTAGGTSLMEDFLSDIPNEVVINEDTYSFESSFYEEPHVMTFNEYNTISDKTSFQGVTHKSQSFWLATAYNTIAPYQFTYTKQNYFTDIDSFGLVVDTTANAPNRMANVRLVMKIDMTSLKKIEKLNLTYTATPQNSLSNYEYKKNVGSDTKIGEVTYTPESLAPTLSIIASPSAPSGHENDYLNFELNTTPTSSPVDVTIKSDAPNLVNGSLKAGTYYFRITGVDENGKPDPAPFQDVVLTVNKTTATLTFDDTSLKDMKIGDEAFTGSVTTTNTDTLQNGDITYTLSGGTPGAVSVVNNSELLKYDVSVPDTFDSSGLPSESILSATLKETENFLETTTTTNRTIKVSKGIGELGFTAKQSSFTPGEVSVANTTIGSLKVSDGVGPFKYELVETTDPSYDSISGADNASFTLSNTPTALNTALDVKIKNALTEVKTYHLQFKVTDTITSEVAYTTGNVNVGLIEQTKLDFKDGIGGNVITTTGKKIKHNKTSEVLFAEGGSSGVPIEYTALPQAQQPSNINLDTIATIDKSSGKITPVHVGTIKVMAKRPGNTTYSDVEVVMELTIEPVEQELSFNDTTDPIKVAIGDTTLADAKATIKDDGSTGVGTITYSSSDTNIASVDEFGNVTGVSAGTITLTVVLNDKNGTGYNPDYEEKTITKTIQVYKKMTLTWADVSPLLKAGSNKVGDKAGTISVKDNASNPSYKISSNTTAENADAGFFHVVGSGTTADVNLANVIGVDEVESHGGVFKVQVDVTDKNSTETIDIEVRIEDAENDIYFTEGGVKVTSLTKQFKENGNTFNLTSNSSNGGSVTYAVDPSDTSGTLSVTGPGVVTIHKVGTAKVSAVVASGGGYDGGTITMEVTITPGSQTIAFKDTTTVKRPFVENGTFTELAELKETSKNTESTRSITYTSNSPSVCSIDEHGEVTMLTKGTCDITASNTDSDWVATTINKQISLFDKMSVVYTATTPNLKAETNAIGNKVGQLQVSDHETPPTYKISTNSTTQNADASFFHVIGNGASADLKLAKKITALDWVSHNGVFKVQVEVADINGPITIDVLVNIDQAENIVSFTENGINITSLTKQYGENDNTFHLTSTSSNAGVVTYGVEPTDTTGTLTVETDGTVTINKVGVGKVEAKVEASGGYASKTIQMDITITPGDQAIAFKDTTTLNQAFMLNGTFFDPAELKETSKNTVSTRTITYTSKDTSICTIDSSGTITMLTKGTCDIDATNRDANWKSVTTNKKINLYDGMGVSFTENGKPQAETTTTSAGAKAGSLTVNGGLDPKTFAVSTNSNTKNKDASYFQVNSTGVVSFKKAIMASDLVGKYNSTKKVYELYVQLETTDSLNTKVTTDVIVEIKGAPLKAEFDTNGTGKVTEVFGSNKTFTLDLSSNKGKGTPTYQLKNDPDMPDDVLASVDASGLVIILHANDKAANPNPVMVEAIIPASNGYDAETIEVEVEITKAPQPDFAFKTPNIKLGYGSKATPIFQNKLSTGTITLSSATPKIASINGNDIVAGTSDGVVEVSAIDSGDRDYQEAIAKATVTVSGAPAYSLILTIPPATYGDTGIKATARAVGSIGTNPKIAWSSSDISIAEIDVDGNLTIHKAGSVTITCTRTTTEEPSVTETINFIIDPKPITVTINNASKYVGEAVPTFNAVIPTDDLVGSDTIDQPTFSCKDGAGLVNEETKAGTYDITGAYPTDSYPNYDITVTKGVLTIKQDTSKNSWFHLEGDTSKQKLDGTKWVNEDVNILLDSAIESAGTYDELSLDNVLWGTSQTITKEGITTSDVNFRIKDKNIISTKQSTTIKIDKTKPVITKITGTKVNDNGTARLLNNVTFGLFFKPGVEVVMETTDANIDSSIQTSGIFAITYQAFVKEGDTFVEIDKGNATLKGTTGKVILSDPGVYRICAIAKDHAGNTSNEYCSELDVKKIGIDVDGDGEKDFLDSDNDGCPDINIILKDEKNEYYKLNVDRDHDDIPDLNIDSDGDGIAEINVDSDEDGKPDLNLLILKEWKPTYCVTDQSERYCTMPNLEPSINISTKKNKIADLNIDTDGDMIADINIDKNGNKALDYDDYNITAAMDLWEPKKDYEVSKFLYDTQENLKAYVNYVVKGSEYPSINLDTNQDGIPDLNIDIDLDGIPDVEIDGDGDGIADVNLDPKGTGTPQENIIKLKSWKPTLLLTKGANKYLTMALEGSNELEDNGVKVEKPSGGVFLPNFALKTEDITKTISKSEKDRIESALSGNGEVKKIFNVSLMKDDISIQPDGTVRVKIPVINGLKNPKLVITQKDGTQRVVEAVEENGYYIYETDYLSMVSVIGDKETIDPTPDETPTTKPSDQETPNKDQSTNKPNNSVKGEYTNGTGGAMTGDDTNVIFYLVIGIGMFRVMCSMLKKGRNQE